MRQLLFDGFHPSSDDDIKLVEALENLAGTDAQTLRGAIFTRSIVAEFILDVIGYTSDQPLHEQRLLEPAFGNGDFLLPAIRRLMSAWRNAPTPKPAFTDLSHAVRAIELHRRTFNTTYQAVIDVLIQEGLDDTTATALTNQWLSQGDFLLSPIEGQFHFVAGNPPYIRQELIPAPLLAAYRQRYQTLYDRADLYIPFIERSLSLLMVGGNLGFICTNRWIKNRYGGPLRRLVAEHFHLKMYVDMVDTPAFQTDVSTYPAITIISREPPQTTRIAHCPSVDRTTLTSLAVSLKASSLPSNTKWVREVAQVTYGDEPWLIESAEQLAVLRRLEELFPRLEEIGCKVGIGVATGADKVFIGTFTDLDVETDRKLPLVTTRDIVSGEVHWQGQYVINPFTEKGQLVHLPDYPRLHHYLETHRDIIAARHCAKKNPDKWYRTIDRITPTLTHTPKLLIPDIKGEAHIVFEAGMLYPHHNLYYVISDTWDLRALQAILMSAVSRLFIDTYSTKIRGGFLRFQAQYLRRIRVPHWNDVPMPVREALTDAATRRDVRACNQAAFTLYGLTSAEQSAVEGKDT
ncbi:MAG: modification methylase PaeR7I [Chloroflexi bacterium AL-N10]|nr:modification methylase PaeR7I [Chloroflexi bacterium AL-N10]